MGEVPNSVGSAPQDAADDNKPDNVELGETVDEEPYIKPGWYHMRQATYYPNGLDGEKFTDLGKGTMTIFKSGHNSVDGFSEGITKHHLNIKPWKIKSYENGLITMTFAGQGRPNDVLTAEPEWFQDPPF